jgi:hypothetical protein
LTQASVTVLYNQEMSPLTFCYNLICISSALSLLGYQPPDDTGNASSEIAIKGIKEIPLPRRESGYREFESTALTNDKELAAFLKKVGTQQHWSHKEDFVSALKDAKIDFQKSSLLLIRNTAGSGSIKVSLEKPSLKGKDIVFRIAWDSPRVFTMDMAFYCFAVTVPKDMAANARIIAPKRPDVVLPLKAKLKGE